MYISVSRRTMVTRRLVVWLSWMGALWTCAGKCCGLTGRKRSAAPLRTALPRAARWRANCWRRRDLRFSTGGSQFAALSNCSAFCINVTSAARSLADRCDRISSCKVATMGQICARSVWPAGVRNSWKARRSVVFGSRRISPFCASRLTTPPMVARSYSINTASVA